jgi:hypothetical protein
LRVYAGLFANAAGEAGLFVPQDDLLISRLSEKSVSIVDKWRRSEDGNGSAATSAN